MRINWKRRDRHISRMYPTFSLMCQEPSCRIERDWCTFSCKLIQARTPRSLPLKANLEMECLGKKKWKKMDEYWARSKTCSLSLFPSTASSFMVLSSVQVFVGVKIIWMQQWEKRTVKVSEIREREKRKDHLRSGERREAKKRASLIRRFLECLTDEEAIAENWTRPLKSPAQKEKLW